MSGRTKGMLLIALAVLICVGGSLLMLFMPSDLDRMTAIAHNAKVTHVRVDEDDDGNKKYTPTFTFADSDHRTFEAVSAVRYTHEIGVGARYDVRYDPKNPRARCLIVGHEHRLRGQAAGAYVCLFVGVVVVAWLVWKEVDGPRASDSTDESSG